MMTLDDILERWIPYRLQAIETLQFAWGLVNESESPRDVQVFVDGRLKLRGNVAAIANPMIEAGMVHARALLEFLGLCARGGHLAQVSRRHPGDVAVEHYTTAAGPLRMAHPDEVLAAYDGPDKEAEEALVSIFELANKDMAHVTNGVCSSVWHEHHLDIACRGIPVLVNNHLYARLGRSIPKAPEVVPHGR
jgi:hypothetical protein